MNLKSGFTLVEIVVVLAIISVLGALAYPSISTYIENGNKVACQNSIEEILSNYAFEVVYDETKTLSTVLANQYNNGVNICPSNGKYTVIETLSGTKEINCSVHTNHTYTVDFTVSSNDTSANKKNLDALIHSSQSFIDYCKTKNYEFKIANGFITFSATDVFADTSITINSVMQDFFGENASLANSISNFRIAIDSEGNILSVSYKKNEYGYIIYPNGNSYQLPNSYFSSSEVYGTNGTKVNPILVIAKDESKIGLIEGYVKLNK